MIKFLRTIVGIVSKTRSPRLFLNRLAGPDLIVARGAGGSFALSAIARVIGLVNAALLARMLLPNGFGLYSYAYAIVGLLAVPAQFGMPTVVTREVAAGGIRGRWDLARGSTRWAHGGVGILSAVILLIAGGCLALLASRLSSLELMTYAIALALIPLLALDQLRGAVLIGLRHVVLGQLSSDFFRPGLMLIALVLAAVMAPQMFESPERAIALLVIAALISYAIGTLILYLVRPRELSITPPTYMMSRWNSSVLPIGLAEGLYLVNQYAGIIILGVFANKAEVGVYKISILAASIAIMGEAAVRVAFSPYYARLAAAPTGHGELQRVCTLAARLSLLVAVPVITTYLLFGRELLGLFFGVSYTRAWLPLVILVAGQLAASAAGSVGQLLYMSNHERDVMLGVGAGAACNVVLCFGLIPWLGAIGAAIAAAMGLVVCNFGLCQRVWVRLHIVPGPFAVLRNRKQYWQG